MEITESIELFIFLALGLVAFGGLLVWGILRLWK